MKILISLTLTLLLCLSLTACGEDKTDNGNNTAGDMISNGMSAVESGVDSVISGADSAMQSAKDGASNSMSLTAKITAEEAKQAALRHAGLSADRVSDVDIDLDRDNGRLIYEIDFNSDGVEYDYDINAETGDVISADKDRN